MVSPGTRFRRLVALVTGATFVVLCGSSSSASALGDGPAVPFVTYHGNNARTGFTTNTSITPSNASSLHLRWSMKSSARSSRINRSWPATRSTGLTGPARREVQEHPQMCALLLVGNQPPAEGMPEIANRRDGLIR